MVRKIKIKHEGTEDKVEKWAEKSNRNKVNLIISSNID